MNEFITGTDRERAQALLAPDEELLWVGKPAVSLLSPPNIFCLYSGGIVIFVSLIAMQCETDDMIPMLIGSPAFVILTVVILMGIILLSARNSRRWVYALTNKRALVITHKGLRAYDIKPYMVLHSRVPKQGLGKLVFEIEKDDESREEWGFLRCRGLSEPLQLLEDMLGGHALESSKSPELKQQELHDSLMAYAKKPRILAQGIILALISLGLLIGSGSYMLQSWLNRESPHEPGCSLMDTPIILLMAGLVCGAISFLTLKYYIRGKRLLHRRPPISHGNTPLS